MNICSSISHAETALAKIAARDNLTTHQKIDLKYVQSKLDEVRIKANKMEERLRKYRNAIEELGFKRER